MATGLCSYSPTAYFCWPLASGLSLTLQIVIEIIDFQMKRWKGKRLETIISNSSVVILLKLPLIIGKSKLFSTKLFRLTVGDCND